MVSLGEYTETPSQQRGTTSRRSEPEKELSRKKRHVARQVVRGLKTGNMAGVPPLHSRPGGSPPASQTPDLGATFDFAMNSTLTASGASYSDTAVCSDPVLDTEVPCWSAVESIQSAVDSGCENDNPPCSCTFAFSMHTDEDTIQLSSTQSYTASSAKTAAVVLTGCPAAADCDDAILFQQCIRAQFHLQREKDELAAGDTYLARKAAIEALSDGFWTSAPTPNPTPKPTPSDVGNESSKGGGGGPTPNPTPAPPPGSTPAPASKGKGDDRASLGEDQGNVHGGIGGGY